MNRRPIPHEHPAGAELNLADVFVPDAYNVLPAFVGGQDGTPAAPTVLLELTGWDAAQLPFPDDGTIPPARTVRILLEVPGAEGISAGILNSLGQLRRIRRNQEGRRP